MSPEKKAEVTFVYYMTRKRRAQLRGAEVADEDRREKNRRRRFSVPTERPWTFTPGHTLSKE